MKERFIVFICVIFATVIAACDDPPNEADADGDTDADGDGDGDGDGDSDGDGDGDGDSDADSDGDVDGDADAETPYHPARYPTDRTLSPLSQYVADELTEIASSGPELSDDVFAKLGASATVSQYFLHCFAGDDIELHGRDELGDTVQYFVEGDAAGSSPFERESLSTVVGRTAAWAIDGSPSPLEQELNAVQPRYAVVMYGTNDMGWYGYDYGTLDWYGENLLTLAELLIERGVVPLLTTIMPRDDSVEAAEWVPSYNLVVRAVAQALQVPLIDFHWELLPLADHGLSGDGIHPNVYVSGAAHPCHFTDTALEHGYNIRNLITIETLHRVHSVLTLGDPVPDSPGPPPTLGEGSFADPFIIDELPFSDLRNTMLSPHRSLDAYTGCDATADESGPELTYLLDVVTPLRIGAMVLDRGEVDIDVHLLDASGTAEGCLARDHNAIEFDLEPGTYWLVLDTFVSNGVEHSGEFIFIVDGI